MDENVTRLSTSVFGGKSLLAALHLRIVIVQKESVGSTYFRRIGRASRRVSRDKYGGIRVAGRVACIDIAAALKVVVLGFWEVCEGSV